MSQPDIQAIQKQIQQVQSQYREWLSLQSKIEQAQKDLQRSHELMQSLEEFYLEGDYSTYMHMLEDGVEMDLTSPEMLENEYSVMSEDALWNASHQHQQVLWWYMNFAVKSLGPKPLAEDEDI
ncbi:MULTISPECIES: DUF4298 domain-containing protein [unclassified Acinetobacter]|uniref:DUF4298 domain-containing protein n=1 Tax=unclassified Acinetobacter TaxID=196816 RepID=UPI0035B82FEC